jgi:hypothetical protein
MNSILVLLFGISILAVLITIIKVISLRSKRSTLINQNPDVAQNVRNISKPQGKSSEQTPAPVKDTNGTQAAVPVIPILPAKCSSCNTPISMNNAKWTGPMSAVCPSCGNGLEVKWKKMVD